MSHSITHHHKARRRASPLENFQLERNFISKHVATKHRDWRPRVTGYKMQLWAHLTALQWFHSPYRPFAFLRCSLSFRHPCPIGGLGGHCLPTFGGPSSAIYQGSLGGGLTAGAEAPEEQLGSGWRGREGLFFSSFLPFEISPSL